MFFKCEINGECYIGFMFDLIVSLKLIVFLLVWGIIYGLVWFFRVLNYYREYYFIKIKIINVDCFLSEKWYFYWED